MGDLVIKKLTLPEEIVIIGVEGILDNNTQDEFDDVIKKIQDEGIYRFVFDLSELKHITSSGIGSFVKIANLCKENYGDVVIVQPHPVVKEALTLFGLFNIVLSAADVNAAVKLLLSPRKR
ncbi:MAG: STAS domain-containing protein [Planctomycetota bacterium]|nr:STAS domain-containing protein [Planctomycetota bacterium]MDI6788042.1 STAS domain-containing protein [Planctomycetota bacterium]